MVNQFFAKAVNLLLCFAIFLAGVAPALAEPVRGPKYQGYDTKVEDLNLQLNAIEERLDLVSKDMPLQVLSLFTNGFSLVDQILQDDSLNEEDQSKLVGKTLDKISDTFFKALRHKEDDRTPDGRVKWFTIPVRTLKQIGGDLAAVVVPAYSKDGRIAHRMVERSRREKMTRQLLKLMYEKFNEQAPLVDKSPDKVREWYSGQLTRLVDRAVNIRMERESAQFWTKVVYLSAGIVLFLAPVIDYAPERTYYSAFESGVINLSVFSTLLFAKIAGSSSKSAMMWVEFMDKINESRPAELSKKIRDTLAGAYNKPGKPPQYFVPEESRMLRMKMAITIKLKNLWRENVSKKSTCETLLEMEPALAK